MDGIFVDLPPFSPMKQLLRFPVCFTPHKPSSEKRSTLNKESICLKCQILFPGENKNYTNNLSSAEFAQRVVKANSSYQGWV